MEIKNLHFYDSKGYELNFNFNSERNCWEGNIYLPPVSLGLYSNSTVFVLEELTVPVEHDTYEKHTKESRTQKIFVFPRPSDNIKNNKLVFKWDSVNTFVDEIFMFSFDSNYIPNKHSSLSYSYNNGPDCETLLVNKFDVYEVNLTDKDIYYNLNDRRSKRVLPIHVAFSSPVQFDGNTYKRTLVMTHDDKEVVRITYFAESIEEDERLRIWNYNLGYNLSPDDTIIFKESDIEEPNPDYILLNEKRKELLIEGHNIYPYVGSYRAILGAIKFFGYDNLNIIEFWKNINPKDENYGKFIMSPKYILSNKECTFIKDTPIDFPNDHYRKGNKLAFTYTINTPTLDVDLYELPYVKEDFNFTFGEVLIKLFALRKKLNKEFMPSTSRIIDIIGEASYFGIQLLKNGYSYSLLRDKRRPIKMSIDKYPDDSIFITDDKFFNDYVFKQEGYDKNENIEGITILNNIKNIQLNDIENQIPDKLSDINDIELSEERKCELFKEYHKSISYTFINTEDVIDNDIYEMKEDIPDNIKSEHDSDNLSTLGKDISAKILLSNTTFHDKTWDEMPYPFKYVGETFNNTRAINAFQFDWEKDIYNPDEVRHDVYLKWCITFSENQLDEDYHDNDRKKYYDSVKERYEQFKNPILEPLLNWKPRLDGEHVQMNEIDDKRKNFKIVKYGTLSEMNDVLLELPFVGYYDVTLTMYKYTFSITTGKETVVENVNEFKKFIKVQPYNLDIRGFYYDSRDIPKDLDIKTSLDNPSDQEDMEKYIIDTLDYLTYIAKHDGKQKLIRRFRPGGYDMQMVMNKYLNKINENQFVYDINNGPYSKQNFWFGNYIIQDGEFIIDNVNKDIVNLIPTLKTAKYIRNGVNVKPYTWIYLTFDYSKIVHRSNPVWVLTNKRTNKKITYEGKYFTCLLRHEGDYNISLILYDEFGNKYSTERNIVVVDKYADYKLYTPFVHDYKSYKEYEKYKNDIKFAALEDMSRVPDDTDVGEYYFSFKNLKLYDENMFIQNIADNTSRLTIEPGFGIGWGYDVPIDIKHFDKLNIILDRDIPEEFKLSLYLVQDFNKYFEYEIKSKNNIIEIKDIENINTSNISYVIFFNHNTDKHDIEIDVENIYLSYDI